MTSKSARTFNEAAEMFGAPSEDERLNELQNLLYSLVGQQDIEPGLRQAMAFAENVEGELYGDLIGPAVDLMAAGVEFEQLKAFFHRAAAFGEARHVSRLLSNIHLTVLLKSPPTTGDGT
ncbi:hypothetical protein [Aureimonas sp. AU20]|uniref:hypothetical protein n=1 Tax=Aureimonas sp. AU20 TaxID=1349819 RepID=UPI000722C8C8|nr:hypothetical protein [Aureimonas sp. AU20]ALN75841.1 hypothetical protein M673_24100 [Aureimonas sp. AU20]